ncbi:MAG: hypothetical protein PVG61_03695 [Dehalococcoidia bacterium]
MTDTDNAARSVVKTAKPIVAGIFNIITGSLGLLISFSLFLLVYVSDFDFENYPGVFPEFITALAVFIASVALVLALLVLISGIYALERRYWGLSLAGSVVAALTGGALGIAALVLIVLSRDEFDRSPG